jgi:hypothetical protein
MFSNDLSSSNHFSHGFIRSIFSARELAQPYWAVYLF